MDRLNGTEAEALGAANDPLDPGNPGAVPWMLAGVFVTAVTATAWAGPQGEQVTHGQASFQRSGDLTVIRAANNTVINYRSFDIGAHEKVQFIQPDALSRVLNRINSAAPTRIDGTLSANGRVYIVNPAGVMFGKGAVIDVARLYAAGGNLGDTDFLRQIDRFTDMKGSVVNHGTISAEAVSLLGAAVANHGAIVADKGAVMMAAGDEILLGEQGDHLYAKIKTEGAAAAAAGTTPAVENTGEVRAKRFSMASGDLYSVAIRTTGKVKAGSIDIAGGRGGVVEAAGRLDASTTTPGATGGEVKILGDRVAVTGASIDASGPAGGGEILVGGNFQGHGPEANAEYTVVTAGSELRADATTAGDGGKVVVWSDKTTRFGGSISAQGAGNGAGGFAEVSGKQNLVYRGQANLKGADGGLGTLLLDPATLTIVGGSGDGDTDGTAAFQGDVSAGLGSILFTDGAPTTVYESEIEGQSATANIILQATTSIITAGSFSGGDVLLAPGSNLTIETRNAAGDGAGGIDLTGGSAPTFRTQGSGTITITGSTDGGAVGDVTIGSLQSDSGAVTVRSNNGTITVNGAINAGSGALTFVADEMDFNGGNDSIEGSAAVAIEPATLVGIPIAINPNATVGGQLDLTPGDVAALKDGFTSITIGAATGQNPIQTRAITFNDPVVLQSHGPGGAITINGDLTGADDATVTLIGPGPGAGTDLRLEASIITNGQVIDIQDDVMLAGASTALDTTAGGAITAGADIHVRGGVSADATASARDLVVRAGTGGGVTLEGAFSAAAGNRVRRLDVQSSGSFTAQQAVNAVGSAPSLAAVSIVSSGPVRFQMPVVADAGLASSGTTFTADPGANITTTDGPVTINHSGNVDLGGQLSTGAGNIDLDSTGGTLRLRDALTATTGNVDLDSQSGTTLEAAADIITTTGLVRIGANRPGLLTTAGDITTAGAAVTFSRGVTLTGPVTIATTASGGNGAVTFSSTLAGPFDLTVDAGSATTTFTGAVGSGVGNELGDGTGAAIALNSASGATTFSSTLATNSGVVAGGTGTVTFAGDVALGNGDTASSFAGDVVLDGLSFTADDGATFGNDATADRVTLSTAAVALYSTNAPFTFAARVDGAQNLTVNSGSAATDFNGAVGSLTPIGSGSGTALTLDTPTGLTTFAETVAAAGRVVATGLVTFRKNVAITGSGVSVFDGDVTLDGMDFSAPAVRFGAVSGTNTLTLSAAPVSITSTSGGVQVEAGVTGAQDLTVSGSTSATFARTVSVGDGTGSSLIVNGGGATFNAPVTTAEGITLNSGTEFADTVDTTGRIISSANTIFRKDVTIGGSGVSVFDDDVTLDGLAFSAPAVRFGALAGSNTLTLSGAPVSISTGTTGIQVEAFVTGAQDLTVNGNTSATFARTVNVGDGTGPSLTIDGDGATFNAAVTTAAGIAANSATEFIGTVSAAGPIVASANTIFRDDVTVTGTGVSIFDDDVTLDGLAFSAPAVRFGAVSGTNTLTLSTAAVSIASTAGGVQVEAGVTGAQDLTVAGATSASFVRAVNIGDGLGPSLIVGGGGATFNAAVTTAQGMTLNAATEFVGTVTAGAPIVASSSTIFRDTTTIGGSGISIFDGDVTLDGLAFTAPAVRFGTLSGSDTVTLSGGDVSITTTNTGIQGEAAFTGAQNLTVAPNTDVNFRKPVNVGTGAPGSTALTINGNGAIFHQTLTTAERIVANTNVDFRGNTVIGGTGVSALHNNVILNNITFAAAGGATFGNTSADQVTLQGAAVSVTSTNAPLIFNSKVDGASAFSTASGTAATTFNAALGSATRLGSLTSAVNGAGTLTAASTISTTGAVTLGGTGAKSLAGAVTADSGFSSVGSTFNNTSAPITTIDSPITLSHTGAITLAAPLSSGAGNVGIESDGLTTATAAGTVTTVAGNITYGATKTGALTTAASNTTSGGAITMNRAVTLTAPVTFWTAAGGPGAPITFGSTVNGGVDLTVNSGTSGTVFDGAVGGATPLGDGTGPALTLLTSGPTVFNSTLAAASGLSAGGAVTFRGNVTLADGDFRTNLTGNTVLDGLTFSAADGVTFGDDASTDQVTLSGGPVSITSTNAALTFLSTVNGGQNLTINSGSAATTFNGAVGASVPVGTGTGAAITLDSTGATQFNSTVTAVSGIDADGPVSFGDNVTLGNGDTATVLRGDVTFSKSGGTVLAAQDGATFGDAATDQVTIGGGKLTVISTPASGPITFNAKVDSEVSGPQALEIDAGAGAVRLGGTAAPGGLGAPIGSVHPLSTLKVTGSPITITADITTIGQQEFIGPMAIGGTLASGGAFDFAGPVTLLSDTTVQSSGSGVTFRQTVDTDVSAGAPRSLRVETTGTQPAIGFQGPVGSTSALSSLTTVNTTGLTNFSGSTVTTTGAQDYTGRVVLETDMTFTAGSARFRNAVSSASPPVSMSVNTPGGATIFDGALGDISTGLLSLLSLSVQASSIAVNGGSVLTSVDQTYTGPVTLGADTTLASTAGGITFSSTLDGAHDLTINARNGTASFGGNVGALSPLGDGSTTTPVTIDANVAFTGSGPLSFAARDGATFGVPGINQRMTLNAGGVSVTSGAGNGPFIFNTAISGAGPLAVDAGTGAVSFTADVGPAASPTPTSLTATGATIALRNVTTAGPQSYTGAATLNGNLTATGPGAITITGPATLAGANTVIQTAGAAAGDDVTITGNVQAQTPQAIPNLSINAGAGDVVLGGTVGSAVAFAPGVINILGSTIALPAITSFGSQTYTGAVTLSGNISGSSLISFNGPTTLTRDITIGTSNGAVSFLGDLTGLFDLVVNGGNINLAGDVLIGDNAPAEFNGAVSLVKPTAQALSFFSGVTFGAAGANSAITLAGGPVTISVGAIGADAVFNGPVNGAAALAVDTSSDVVFNAPIGQIQPLASLQVTTHRITVNGANTTGAQSYNGDSFLTGNYTASGPGSAITFGGAATLQSGVIVTTTGGPVAFNSTLDGARDLIITAGAGTTTFAGAIGATTPLGDGIGNALTLNSTGPTFFNGIVTTAAGISTSGPVTMTEDVTTGNGDDVPSFFRGPTTLDGLTFNAADGVVFVGDVLVGGPATSFHGTQANSGRIVFRRGLNAMPGTSPDVTITSAVIRLPDSQGSASTGALGQPAIQLGMVGDVTPLKSLTLGADLGVIPKEATVLIGNDRNGNGIITNDEVNPSDLFTINTTGDFTMGQNQKVTTLGSLTINAEGDVALGDLSSLGSINVNAGGLIRLLVRDRTPNGIYDTGGASGDFSSDLGLDFVAKDQIRFNKPPEKVSPTLVDFATNEGLRTPELSDYSFRAFSNGVDKRLLSQGGADVSTAQILSLDLRAQGPTETNIASALAGALPRIDERPEAVQTAISESLRVQLEQMGIFVKDLRIDEVIEFLVGRTVYRDVPQRVKPESGDFRISARRLPADAVERVVTLYLDLRDEPALDDAGHAIVDDAGKPVMIEQWETIRDTFANAWNAFVADPDRTAPEGVAPNGAAFRAWLESKYGPDGGSSTEDGAKALRYLNQVREMFNGLDSMGLSPQEVKYPKNKVLGEVTPPDMDATQMDEAVIGAPSTSRAGSDPTAISMAPAAER